MMFPKIKSANHKITMHVFLRILSIRFRKEVDTSLHVLCDLCLKSWSEESKSFIAIQHKQIVFPAANFSFYRSCVVSWNFSYSRAFPENYGMLQWYPPVNILLIVLQTYSVAVGLQLDSVSRSQISLFSKHTIINGQLNLSIAKLS